MNGIDGLEFSIPFPIIDTHFHTLLMQKRKLDVDGILYKAAELGLAAAVDVAVDENQFDLRLAFADRHPGLSLSSGIHPSSTVKESLKLWEKRFSIIEEQARRKDVVAIGESGLDFFRDHSPHEIQERAFRYHLELADNIGKPIIVHNRNADSRILAIIRESPCRKGVLHCFSSDWDTASKALDLGFSISFAGNISYPKTDDIREAAEKVPKDRLLIETDSPYLSPQVLRSKSNHPGHLGFTLETLAEIRNDEIEEIAEQTTLNAKNFFRIPLNS